MTTIAAIQMTSGPDVEANLAMAGKLLEEAARRGAAIAGLPENFAFMGLKEGEKLGLMEADGDGPIQNFLATTARRLGLWIIGGTVPVSEGKRAAAACPVYDAQGERRARYDKIHLFDVDVPAGGESHRESSSTRPGRDPVVLDTPAGKLGLAVCYDLRFPELFRALCAAGADWFCLPSAFTWRTGRAHWEVLLRARAIENLAHICAPAQSGTHHPHRETWGDTLIANHWGQILTRLPRGQGVVTANVDLEAQARARQAFPALQHRILK
jgi:nitrilase